RAANSYINMPKNSRKYTAEQVANIKSKIHAAGKKLGIEFADDSKKAALVEKSLYDVPSMSQIVLGLKDIVERQQMERAMEGDESDVPNEAQAVLNAACDLLASIVAEAAAEIKSGEEVDADDLPGTVELAAGDEMAAEEPKPEPPTDTA